MRLKEVEETGKKNAQTVVEHLRWLPSFGSVRPVLVEILPPNAKPGDLPFRFYGTFSIQLLSDGTSRSRFDLAGTLAPLFMQLDRRGNAKIVFRDADVPEDEVVSDWFVACHYDGPVKDCCPVGSWFCLMRWPHERHGRMAEKLSVSTFHVTTLTDLKELPCSTTSCPSSDC